MERPSITPEEQTSIDNTSDMSSEISSTLISKEALRAPTSQQHLKILGIIPFVISMMIVGILIICFTAPKQQKKPCPLRVVSQLSDWVEPSNRKLPIALGDFNNDQQLDIIVAHHENNNLHIFLGYGNGAFPVTPNFTILCPSPPYSIAVGDFNRDNELDIVVAYHDYHSIVVYFGSPNGTFNNQTIYSTGISRPLSLTVYDLNNDTYLDIIVSNYGTNSISIYLGVGNGMFEENMTLLSGYDALPNEIFITDLNKDDRPDIIVVNTGTNNIGVFIGHGNGSFSNQTTYLTGIYPVSIAIADLNDDTRPDIVVANNGSNNICVLFGIDNGYFRSCVIYETGFNSHPSSVVLNDFNKDDRLDIVVTLSGTNNLALFLGNGNGTFQSQILYQITIGAPLMVVSGDLNNDSWTDVVVSIHDSYNVGIFLAGPDKNLTNKVTYSTGPASFPVSLTVGDLNNDTSLDIVEINSRTNSIGVFLGHGDGTFTIKSGYSTGTNSQPSANVFGDLNNDQRLDTVVANSNAGNIGIFLGNGDGTFSTQTTYSTGLNSQPISVVLGDFNNDAVLDIVVANYEAAQVGFFFGIGDGTFSNQSEFATEGYPIVVNAGDLDNDGHLDIIVVNSEPATVEILFGHGDGTFFSENIYSMELNSTPTSATLGHFNSDNQLDIVVVDSATSILIVLLGNGNGTIEKHDKYPIANDPYWVVVGDMNNDTYLDIIVAHYRGNSIGVMLGKGDGTFSTQVSYSTGWDSLPAALAIGDFNSDNRLDVAVAMSYYFSIGIFIGYYNSPFTSPAFYSSGLISTPNVLAIADLNNDNNLDIISGNQNDGTVGVYLNSGSGTFPNFNLYTTGYPNDVSSVAVGDFNNDTLIDIVAASHDSDNVAIFLSVGNGRFKSAISYSIASNSGPCSVAVNDFNEDGRLDIVSANNRDDTITVFVQHGFGAFKDGEKYSTANDKPSRSVAFGDFNKDNKLDLVVTNEQNCTITVLFENGNGSFSNQTTYSTGYDSYPYSVVVMDFNNDTNLDLAVANKFGLNVGIFLGNGDGTFSNQTTYWTGNFAGPLALAVGDLNNDNRPDFIVSVYSGYYICIFLGNGDGTFAKPSFYYTGDESLTCGVVISDFNNDMIPDIAVANRETHNVGIFLGFGDGTFSNQTTHSTGDGAATMSLAIGDFNKDNHVDIVVANYGTDNVGIFLGNGDGTFSEYVTYYSGHLSGPYWIAVGDFNKDDLLDVVAVLSLSDNLAIFFGDGNGTFSNPMLFTTGSSTYPWYVIVKDFNSDNWLDVAVVLGNVAGVTIFYGDMHRLFLVQGTYSTDSASTPQAVTTADLNGDQHMDIAVVCSKSNNVAVFLGYGNGQFSKKLIYSTGVDSQPWSIAIGDLNNDTSLDIVVANRNSSTIGVFIGYGNGTFRHIVTHVIDWASDPVAIAIADYNNDGKLDVAVANNLAFSVRIFEGCGDGTFCAQTTYLTDYKSHPVSLVTGDFNVDNFTDIAIATPGTKNLKILLKSC